jgi:hypothetical protein
MSKLYFRDDVIVLNNLFYGYGGGTCRANQTYTKKKYRGSMRHIYWAT